MPLKSAGLLMYRRHNATIEVLLVHPGGPFWASKDRHAWSIPKGEYTDDEEPLAAARREFREELGFSAAGACKALGAVRQSGGKIVRAWACEGDCDPAALSSNTFTMEWPPGSGQERAFPEVDRAAWFPLAMAHQKLHKSQATFLDTLAAML